MKLAARMEKLKARAKVACRCDWCLYALVDTLPSRQKSPAAEPATSLNIKCWWCGTVYRTPLSNDKHVREAQTIYGLRAEGDYYRKEKVYAAKAWHNGHMVIQWWRSGKMEEHERKSDARTNRQPQKLSRQQQAQAELKDRAEKFKARMKAEEQEKYGPATFKLVATIGEVNKFYFDPYRFGWCPGEVGKKMSPAEVVARRALYWGHVMEACEVVLWGKVLPETVKAMAECEVKIKACEDDRAAEAARKEEEKRQREEERQRRNEEYMARQRGEAYSAPAQPARASLDGPPQSPIQIPHIEIPPARIGLGAHRQINVAQSAARTQGRRPIFDDEPSQCW